MDEALLKMRSVWRLAVASRRMPAGACQPAHAAVSRLRRKSGDLKARRKIGDLKAGKGGEKIDNEEVCKEKAILATAVVVTVVVKLMVVAVRVTTMRVPSRRPKKVQLFKAAEK